MKNRRIYAWLLAIVCSISMLLTGCAGTSPEAQKKKVVLTAGFKKNEVFKIEDVSGTLPEIMVYLVTMQNQYEALYGKEIWQTNLGDQTLADSVKETILANLAQVKAMNLLAKKYDVTLSADDLEKITLASREYYGSLNDTEIQVLGVTPEIIEQMYQEYALAHKVYRYIIKDINPEISDDEARTITVDHIFIKTYEMDGTGTKIEYSEERRQEAYEKAKEILAMAREEGSDFKELVLQYSDGDKGTYSFGKGETEPAFEEAAFNLATGEISDIIETPYGFHIIKCLSTFDKEQTSANKIKIVEEKREEVFGEEYDVFAGNLTKDLNKELWNTVQLVDQEDVTTQDFFVIYRKYMEKATE